jgi:DNA-binding transcriptional LysR family regulator
MRKGIGVLNPGEDATFRPSFHIKKSVAEDLVRRGLAIWLVPEHTIQKLANERLVRAYAPKQLGITSSWPKKR